MQARPWEAAWVHGSVPLGWYFAPHRPNSRVKALSVSVSLPCCARSCASCGAGGGAGFTGKTGCVTTLAVAAAVTGAALAVWPKGRRVSRAMMASTRVAARPPATAQGIQCGAKRRPNTSVAAARTSEPVTRWRSIE
jgi:hypothetical protein